MQIRVIQDTPALSAASLLRAIQRELAGRGIATRIVEAEAYSDATLCNILEVMVSGGDRELLVDNCSRAQVEAVLLWQCEAEEGELEDLQIHLVRRV